MVKNMYDTAPTRIDPNTPDAGKVAAYGAFSFLYMRSNLHRDLTLTAMRALLEPPIAIGSYKVFQDAQGVPRAATTWASLSEAAQEKLFAHETLAPEDWGSGPHMWVIEIVAPFGHGSGSQVMHWLRHSISKDVPKVSFARLNPTTKDVRVIECHRGPTGRLGARLVSRGRKPSESG